MKLLLGCGEDRREGWTHLDIVTLPHVDVVHDLRVYPWPVDDDAATHVHALDVLEHLPDTMRFMDECWRVLAAGGELFVQVPHVESDNAWRDPTHARAFHPTTFDYFDPVTTYGKRYGFYTDRKWKIVNRIDKDRDGNIQVWLTPEK